jgi:acetoin utilization deacetylase AcuC-like enzyme
MIAVSNHPLYRLPLPEHHRFPMLKYELLPEQLMHHGIITSKQFISPVKCPTEIIELVHSKAYLSKLLHQELSDKEQRSIGFPQSPQLVDRELHIMQGTIDCALHAIRHNTCSLNIAGGTHHAFADRGEGFCLLNDMAIAAEYLYTQTLAQKILIVDLDVHQGNGTASICAGKEHIFTLSMHGAHNYPFKKEQSTLDIPLADGIDGTTYMTLLKQHLPSVLDTFKPNIALYLCGVDVLHTDKFGKLNLTLKECALRDLYVFEQLKERNIPCACAMGGGYSADVKVIVDAHCNTFIAACNIW